MLGCLEPPPLLWPGFGSHVAPSGGCVPSFPATQKEDKLAQTKIQAIIVFSCFSIWDKIRVDSITRIKCTAICKYKNIAVQQDNGVPAGQNKKCASKRSMDARKSISLRIMVELKMFEGSKACKTNQSFSKDLLPTFTSLEGSRNGALLLVVLLLCQLQRC